MERRFEIEKIEISNLYSLITNPLRRDTLARKQQGVGVVIISDRKILMVQENRKDKKYGTEVDMWSFPAGTMEKEESPADTAMREVLEETNSRITSLEYFGSYFYTNQAIGHIYLGNIDPEPDGLKSNDSDIKNVKWIPIERMLNGEMNLRPFVKEIVMDVTLNGHDSK